MIIIVEYRRSLWCVVHMCTCKKSYYLNTTCCHAVYIHPYCKTDVFLSSSGLRSSFRLSLVQGAGWCPRRGVCLRPTLWPWCFFQTRPGSEMQTEMGEEPVSCYLTLRIRIRLISLASFDVPEFVLVAHLTQVTRVQDHKSSMFCCPKDAITVYRNQMLSRFHKYFACKRDLHAISQGISCIIFIQLTGVPFEARHILFIAFIVAYL